MSLELYLECEETEAKIANIETVEVMIVNGVRREVPSISSILSKLQSKNCFEFSVFLMYVKFCVVETKMWVVIWMDARGIVISFSFLYFHVGPANARERDPVIVTLV